MSLAQGDGTAERTADEDALAEHERGKMLDPRDVIDVKIATEGADISDKELARALNAFTGFTSLGDSCLPRLRRDPAENADAGLSIQERNVRKK